MAAAKKKSYVIRFVNAFARYHRDKSNAEIFQESMERIHLATEKKVLLLSRENNTRYEFLLPHEQSEDKAPTFLFDANNRIMISSAINHADRLSSCSKTGRKLLADKKGPFNLHVFQTRSDEELAATADDLHTRYNVNGIELSAPGFKKLSHEIDLKALKNEFSDPFGRKSKLYTGKFPTQSGRYQRLVIREAQIPVVHPTTLKSGKITSKKYFEVCTHPKLYAYARKMTR
jgi:hypothetical protein